MKRMATIIFATSLLSGSALAQSGTQQAGQGTVQPLIAQTQASSESFLATQSSNQVRAEELIGTAVTDVSGEKIGKVQDLVIDKNGQLAGVIVSVGGFLGIGDKEVALPWNKLEPRPVDGLTVAAISKDQIDQAPVFKNREQQAAERQAQEYRRQRDAAEAAERMQSPGAGGAPKLPPQQSQ